MVWEVITALQADLATGKLLVTEEISNLEPEPVSELLHTTHGDLKALQDAAWPFLHIAPYLGWVPHYGPDVEAVPVLLDIALHLTAAGESAAEPLTSLFEVAERGGGSNAGTTLGETTTALTSARSQLMQARSSVRQARMARENLDVTHLAPQLQRWLKRLDRYFPLLEHGLQVALLAPELLGTEKARTYLILVQNEDELRATGGFISGVARITVERGHIVDLYFEDSYAVDDFSKSYPVAPRPVREIWGPVPWVFRDSNWSPDFPTAAQRAVALYQLRYDDVTVDGVIALDQAAVRHIVNAVDPLDVAGYSRPVTADTVIQAARAAWAPPESEGVTQDWWDHRKDFMGRVFVAAVRKLQQEPTQINFLDMGQAIIGSLEERHLFIYLSDREASSTLREAGWDGAIQKPLGDYLMVVDTNLGLNKVNPLISETLTYTVNLRDPKQPKATLKLLHQHTGPKVSEPCIHGTGYDSSYEQMMQRCYWDYVRIYTPQGSQLLKATHHPVPARLLLSGQEHPGEADVLSDVKGKSVFATFFVLERGRRMKTDFAYQLSPNVIERTDDGWRYHLYLQKQAGTEARDMRIIIHPPVGAELLISSPSVTQRRSDKLVYRLNLRTDSKISVSWRNRP
jgi:hypothetical protein